MTPFLQPPPGVTQLRTAASATSETPHYSGTRLCAWGGEKQNSTNFTTFRINSWHAYQLTMNSPFHLCPVITPTCFSFLLSKLHLSFVVCVNTFPIPLIKTSLPFSVSCPLLPLLSSLLSDLCFVPNSMWLSLIPGSNVLVWVSLTVYKKEERCLLTQWGDICNALEGKLSHFGQKL